MNLSSGIGLETSILFAKEGASVLMSDVSAPALEKAVAKVKQLVPNAVRVATVVSWPSHIHCFSHTEISRNVMLARKLKSRP